jgi:CRP/FNR family transcriptional regulator, cyclic AMP receptor protein
MHNPADIDDHLSQVPLFSTLSTKELRSVRGLLTRTEVAPGQVLAREGAIGHEFFIILEGTAAVEREGVHLADVGAGDFQGEISLLDGGPRTATVTATTAMTILVASQREFDSLLDSAPSIARQMLPALAHRVRALTADAITH